jgi:hypothetical protein
MDSGECVGRSVISLTLEIVVEEIGAGVLKEYFKHELAEALTPSAGILTAMIREAGIGVDVVNVDCKKVELNLANEPAIKDK